MRVTLNTDYTLRVLIYLAIIPDRLATIQEIADNFDISRAHLTKIVHRLGQRGYVTTIRGKKGGIKLLKPSSDIRIGAIVRETEEGLAVLECLRTPDYCVITQACILRHVFHGATQAFLAVLDRYTLADFMKPRASLAKMLGIN